MNWAQHLKLFAKLGMAALALGALAISGNAQNKPFETHWGAATPPAGDYAFTLPSASSPYRLYIRGQAGNAIIMATTTDDRVVSNHAQLNLVDIADVQTVQTFDAPELGLTFVYWTPKEKHMGHKEAQSAVPQTAPTSKVSENKTSIEVRAGGR